jgi:hypothetical protein
MEANGKLEALRKRETALREAIAKEKIREQKTKAKAHGREAQVIGEALLDHAEHTPDFKLVLKQILASASVDDAARKFLAARGWV